MHQHQPIVVAYQSPNVTVSVKQPEQSHQIQTTNYYAAFALLSAILLLQLLVTFFFVFNRTKSSKSKSKCWDEESRMHSLLGNNSDGNIRTAFEYCASSSCCSQSRQPSAPPLANQAHFSFSSTPSLRVNDLATCDDQYYDDDAYMCNNGILFDDDDLVSIESHEQSQTQLMLAPVSINHANDGIFEEIQAIDPMEENIVRRSIDQTDYKNAETSTPIKNGIIAVTTTNACGASTYNSDGRHYTHFQAKSIWQRQELHSTKQLETKTKSMTIKIKSSKSSTNNSTVTTTAAKRKATQAIEKPTKAHQRQRQTLHAAGQDYNPEHHSLQLYRPANRGKKLQVVVDQPLNSTTQRPVLWPLVQFSDDTEMVSVGKRRVIRRKAGRGAGVDTDPYEGIDIQDVWRIPEKYTDLHEIAPIKTIFRSRQIQLISTDLMEVVQQEVPFLQAMVKMGNLLGASDDPAFPPEVLQNPLNEGGILEEVRFIAEEASAVWNEYVERVQDIRRLLIKAHLQKRELGKKLNIIPN